MKHALPIVALVEAAFLLLSTQGLGFPDGHLTELDRARKEVYPLGAGAFIAQAVATQFRISRRTLLAVFLALNAAWVAFEVYCRATLEHGGGG